MGDLLSVLRCYKLIVGNLRKQHFAIEFCVQLFKTITETYSELHRALDEDIVSRKTCFRWHKDFKECRENPELQLCDSAPVTTITEKVILKTYAHITIR